MFFFCTLKCCTIDLLLQFFAVGLFNKLTVNINVSYLQTVLMQIQISMIIHHMILKMTRKKIQFHYRNIEVLSLLISSKLYKNNLLGKTLLIVITATYCQYTQQYPYLNQLKNSYTSDHFEILAFPCNQFGLVRSFFFLKISLFITLKQEPGVTGAEILNGIRFVRRMFDLLIIEMNFFIYLAGNNYIPNFPMFERSDVNGYGERPLFTFLKVKLKTIKKMLNLSI